MAAGSHLEINSKLNSYPVIELSDFKTPYYHVSHFHIRQNIAQINIFVFFNMAAGGHLGFCKMLFFLWQTNILSLMYTSL